MLRNKRGNMSILLLVLLILIIVMITLFFFITSSNLSNAKISGLGVVNEVNREKNSAELSLRYSTEDALVASYNEMTQNGNYISNPSFDSDLYVKFTSLNENLNSELNSKFIEKFSNTFADKTKLASSFDGQNLLVDFGQLKEITEHSEDVNITYYPSFSLSLNLSKVNLDSFDKIYSVKESCKVLKSSSEIENCFNSGLVYYYAIVFEKKTSQTQSSFVVTLTSKKNFFLDGKLQKISFVFLLN